MNHRSVSVPYSSIALAASSKAAMVVFDFTWVTNSFVGFQQHLILGSAAQSCRAELSSDFSVGSSPGLGLCLHQPCPVPAWLRFVQG